MNNRRLCVIGLGLMGGSLARALHGKTDTLIGVDRHAATRQQALADGVVDVAVAEVKAGVSQADFVILATPVHTILQILDDLPYLKPQGCLVLDLGSTKLSINEAMSALPPQFEAIGGHPMCGKETAGYAVADPNLFVDKAFILTRNERTSPEMEAVALELIESIGSNPLFLPAAQHDELVAAISHLPYVLSATLMHYAAALDDDLVWQTSASGFRDTARLAGSDPQMLFDILLTNRTAVLDHLRAYQHDMAQVIQLLETGNEEALSAWLSDAQRNYLAYRRAKDRD